MSKTNPTAYEGLELRWPCHHCHAKVGEWCTTKTGRHSQFLHSSRHYKAAAYLRSHKGWADLWKGNTPS